MSILAIDIGKKRIGIAISQSGLLSSEYCTIPNQDSIKSLNELIFIIKKENVDKLVIGLPKNMDGTDSDQTKYVRDYADKLKEKINNYKLNTEIFFEDERLTSKEAERELVKLDLTPDKIKARRDQMSAKIILDQFL